MLRAYLELLRPANVATALADVLAGFAVAGLANRAALPWLLGATACLYAGGVVLNDYFDREIDRVERPERPIPSGRVPARAAGWLGGILLAAGVLFASGANPTAAIVALAVAALVLFYDAAGKRLAAVASINMGLCRATNLLLGMAAVPPVIGDCWPLALIPLTYIFAVTTISRGEVHGGSNRSATIALAALGFAWLSLVIVAARSKGTVWPPLLLAAVAGWRVIPPFVDAWRTPSAPVIRRAVMRGVLSLVIVDATIGAAYGGPAWGAVILATGLLAGWFARVFAVT
jgi:4-hydroxybenzoate polyprenyltransferase